MQPACQHAVPQVHGTGPTTSNLAVLQPAVLYGAHPSSSTPTLHTHHTTGGMEGTQKGPQINCRHVAVCHQPWQGRPSTRGTNGNVTLPWMSAPTPIGGSPQGRTSTMPSFNWTGDLRPERVGPRRPVPSSIPKPDWATGGIPYEEMDSPQQSLGTLQTPSSTRASSHAKMHHLGLSVNTYGRDPRSSRNVLMLQPPSICS